jgi:hypothetical protein
MIQLLTVILRVNPRALRLACDSTVLSKMGNMSGGNLGV